MSSTGFLNPRRAIDRHGERLPHWQQGDSLVFITWHVADALPQEAIRRWQAQRDAWRRRQPEPWDDDVTEEFINRFGYGMDDELDKGAGRCLLRRPACAACVERALRCFHGERYELDSFAVMPNHVHVLARLSGTHRLQEVVQSWKGFSSREINRRTGESGTFWQPNYWDRIVRDEGHLARIRTYILKNPEKAKLKEGEYLVGRGGKDRNVLSPEASYERMVSALGRGKDRNVLAPGGEEDGWEWV